MNENSIKPISGVRPPEPNTSSKPIIPAQDLTTSDAAHTAKSDAGNTAKQVQYNPDHAGNLSNVSI